MYAKVFNSLALVVSQALALPPKPLVQPTNLVVAHFIVGNAYNYTVDNWAKDMSRASSKGIDGFALNVGSDPWEPARVADAYAAALKTDFKLFLSFDVTSLPCSRVDDASPLQAYIREYASHPNQLVYSGRMLVSTFGGEHCTFGSRSVDEGWTAVVRRDGLPPLHFIPAFFVDPKDLVSLRVLDGVFNWRASWPVGQDNVTFGPDDAWIQHLGGRDYMAGVSPWFFTHYGKASYDKNFVMSGDNWLLARRWRLLVENRHKVGVAQIVTWNDFGESSYVGPIEGVQPQSQAWTNGFDNHEHWLDLMSYFIQAFKTGVYPRVTEDRLFMWAKLLPTSAVVSADPVGRPADADNLKDALWAIAFLCAPAQVTLRCGNDSMTAALRAGVSELALPLRGTCRVEGIIARWGVEEVHVRPEGFTFGRTSQVYNFNAFVAVSPRLADGARSFVGSQARQSR